MRRWKKSDPISLLVWALIGLFMVLTLAAVTLLSFTVEKLGRERSDFLASQARRQADIDHLARLGPRLQVEMLQLLRLSGHSVVHTQVAAELVDYVEQLKAEEGNENLIEIYTAMRQQAQQLNALFERSVEWHRQSRRIEADLQQGNTLGSVRQVVQDLHNVIAMARGQQRLSEAVRIRRWRSASDDEAHRIARSILNQRGEFWYPLLNEVEEEMSELEKEIEILASEERLDYLVDLRDNILKPVLEMLERNLSILVEQNILPAQATIEYFAELKDRLFGQGHRIDSFHQTVVATGGLYQLQLDLLRLKERQQALEQAFQAQYADFSENAYRLTGLIQEEMQEVALQTEKALTADMRKMVISALVAAVLFILLGLLISARVRRQVLALSRLQLRKSLILNSAEEGIVGVDTQGCIVFFNRAASQLLGYETREAAGRPLAELLSYADEASAPDSEQRMCAAWEQGRSVFSRRAFFWNSRRDKLPVSYSMTPMWSDEIRLEGAVLVFRDITEEEKAHQRLQEKQLQLNHLAYHDPLTNLPNRRLLIDRLYHAMDRAERNDAPLSLFFLDLDRFKKVNDTLGHEMGDLLLIQVAQRLQACLRKVDTLARLGGDEFVVLIEDPLSAQGDAVLARKLLQELARVFVVEDQSLYVSGSLGISRYPTDAGDVKGLMSCADMAMFHAKERGKNNFQFYTPELNARAQEFLELETQLRTALENDQFLLYFQPQLHIESGAIVGVEALLRWQHPERGMIPPDKFIPLAEETGLIIALGDWVLEHVCAWCKRWRSSGHEPVRVAVNISGLQFAQADLDDRIGALLGKYALSAHWLEVELTESILMEDSRYAIDVLKKLKHRGIHLAIDDFGTGYSSLSYLKRLPVHKLKIDRSFIDDVLTDEHDAAIARSVISLGKTMNLEVIAEGVETREQAEFLLANDCVFAQGYLYARPMPADEIERYLASGNVRSSDSIA